MKWLLWRLPKSCCQDRGTLLQAVLLLLSIASVFAIDCSRSITGRAEDDSDGIIQSLGFPNSYPKLGMRYACTFTIQELSEEGHVKISFDDFHLDDEVVYTCKNNGTYDYLTINFDNNQSPLYHCGIGRPPALISPKNIVTVELVVHRRSSNDAAFRGFRMRYEFISAKTKMELSSRFNDEDTLIPRYRNDEGTFSIPLVRPVVSPYTSQSLHVIWYVTAPMETQRIQLSIIDFKVPPYAAAPMVVVADGPTSLSPALLSRTNVNAGPFFSTQRFMFVELNGVVPAGISFRANFSFFSDPIDNGACRRGLKLCRQSQQCILPELFCNGRDNCGQREDESGCNSLCKPNPCKNRGVCRDMGNTFSCLCTQEYTGALCTDDKPFSTLGTPTCADACFNGGQCVEGECQCPSSYIGSRCEFPVSGNTVPDLENTSIMIGAFVGAVCLLSICWLVAMARKRYTEQEEQQTPGTRPPQRMISVHSPEELGLGRSVTSGPGDMEIPPEYSEVFMDDDDDKPAPVIIPISEPMSPPPSYDLVTDDDDGGIIIDLSNRGSNLPDIDEHEGGEVSAGPTEELSEPVPAESISRQSSRSTDV